MVQAHAQQLLNQKESESGAAAHDQTGQRMLAATRRLASALDLLEYNLEHMGIAASSYNAEHEGQLTFFANENEALRLERENLNSAIEQLRFQYNDLHQVASTIYSKLDDSIKRLTQIIEN